MSIKDGSKRFSLQGIGLSNIFSSHLFRSIFGSIGIEIANRLLLLLLSVLLARTLGVEGYGIYVWTFAIMRLLMVVAEAGVPTLLLREVAANCGQKKWREFKGVFLYAVRWVVFVSVCVSATGISILFFFEKNTTHEFFLTLLLMLLLLPVAALLKTLLHAMQGLQHVITALTFDMVLRPLLILLIVITGALISESYWQPYFAIAAQLLGVLVILLLVISKLRSFWPKQSFQHAPIFQRRKWFRNTLPFILIGGAGVLNNQTDILMLGWIQSPEEVGIYRVAAQGGLFVSFILKAAQSVLGPTFADLYAKDDQVGLRQLFRKATFWITLTTLPLCLLFIIFGDFLINLIFGEAYIKAYWPLVILAVGYLLNISFGPVGQLLQMSGKEAETAWVLWLTVVLNIVLNMLLIPAYGVSGAAFATSISIVTYHAVLRYIAWHHKLI